MSETFVLTGRSNVLECTFTPPVLLDLKRTHYIGIVDFAAYNSIANVDASNQKFHYGGGKLLLIPRGAYEIEHIAQYLKQELGPDNITVRANNSTLKCEIKSTYDIDFRPDDSIGRLLGFGPHLLKANQSHESDQLVNVTDVNMICVECNIATGSYVNGSIAHTIFAFSPTVPPGYKMVLSPRTIIYNRLNTRTIDRLRINIVDQDGRPIDFGDEVVTVRLHIKSDG